MLKPISYFVFALALLSCQNGNSTTNDQNETVDSAVVEDTVIPEDPEEFEAATPEEINFKSLDGLYITGMLYEVSPEAPVILLCHQAGYNLHEYDEIAPKLNEMGFNCISIDQRSGGELHGFENMTNKLAKEGKLGTTYVDAEQDIIASIDYAYDIYKQPVILWGSSYSSALALHIAAENEKLRAVISFSPGDYFGDQKPALKTVASEISIPFWITSSKSEAADVSQFLEGIRLDPIHVQFIPKNKGKHGSKALWEDHKDNAEYWNSIEKFLLAIQL